MKCIVVTVTVWDTVILECLKYGMVFHRIKYI